MAHKLKDNEVFDLVVEYLSTKGFNETAQVLKREVTTKVVPNNNNNKNNVFFANAKGSRLEDLLEKSYVTELASGEFLPKKALFDCQRSDREDHHLEIESSLVNITVTDDDELSTHVNSKHIEHEHIERKMDVSTQIVSYNPCPNDPYGASSMPIYQTATFAQPSSTQFGEYDYSRSGNPTRDALQKQLAMLEGVSGAQAFCFTTGLFIFSMNEYYCI